MTTKKTTKKFQLVSKYANYPTWDEKQNTLGVVQFVVPLHFSKNILLCTNYVPDYVPRLKNLEHFK